MKFIARIIGILITLAAFAFVGRTIYQSFGELLQQLASPSFLSAVAGSAITYAVIVQFCALAWYRLLTAFEEDPTIGVGRALGIWGRTQIYKYLPSNILHLVGRYGLCRKAGVSNKALAFAQIYELLIIIMAATVVSALLAGEILIDPLFRRGDADLTLVGALIVGGLVVLVGVAVLAHMGIERVGYGAFIAAAAAFVLYVLFFVASGLLIVVLCRNLSGSGEIGKLIGIGTVAWLAGFLVPGAPSGLGVRETFLIAGLSSVGISKTDAAAVALGYRFVTIAGDGLVALGAHFVSSEGERSHVQ